MGKFLKAPTAYYWEAMVNDKVSPTYKKVNSGISIALNILIPSVLLFVFKVSIPTFLISFVIFDVIQVLLEYGALSLYKGIKNISWLTEKKQYIEKLNEMSPMEIEKLKKDLSQSQSFYKEKMSLLNKKIEEYKSFDIVSIPNARKQDIAYVEEIIIKLENYDNVKWIKKRMKEIVSVSKRLIDLVKEDPDSVQAIVNTYNIYAEELLNIISQYEDMDDEQKAKYQPKIEKLMDVFISHLEEREDKIQSYKEHSIDFNIDFLTKKLQESEQSESDEDV